MHGNKTVVQRGLLADPSDYLIATVISAAVFVTGGIWLPGQLSALAFRQSWPSATLADAIGAATRLPQHLADPRLAWPEHIQHDLPGPVAFYLTALFVFGGLATGIVLLIRRFGRARRLRGFASRAQLASTLSHQAALQRAERLRPQLRQRKPGVVDVAVDLSTAVGTGTKLAATIDNSVLLLAAPRQGKTSQVIIPWLHSWPGPALVTSVRPDVVENTLTLRRERGPVAIMDLTGSPVPHRLRWSPLHGCEQFDKARERADIMIQVGKHGKADSTNAGFFGLTATNLLAGWMHAAAITGRTMDDVLVWALDEQDDTPVKLLADGSGAHPLVGSMLETIYNSPTETRSNMWATTLTGVAPLLSRAARETFCPPVGASFDIEHFLGTHGTVFLTVSESQAADLAPLISAFVDEITTVAKRLGDRAETGRLDPPLGLILDEVANVVPLPNLPALMSYAGGSGIFVTAVLQNMAQARHRWGSDGAQMLWGAATVKIAVGGLTGEELRNFSELAGEYRETVTTPQRGPHGVSHNTHLADRKTMTPDAVRTLSERDREALVIAATTPAVKTRMVRHYEGPHAKAFAAAVEEARQLMREAR